MLAFRLQMMRSGAVTRVAFARQMSTAGAAPAAPAAASVAPSANSAAASSSATAAVPQPHLSILQKHEQTLSESMRRLQSQRGAAGRHKTAAAKTVSLVPASASSSSSSSSLSPSGPLDARAQVSAIQSLMDSVLLFEHRDSSSSVAARAAKEASIVQATQPKVSKALLGLCTAIRLAPLQPENVLSTSSFRKLLGAIVRLTLWEHVAPLWEAVRTQMTESLRAWSQTPEATRAEGPQSGLPFVMDSEVICLLIDAHHAAAGGGPAGNRAMLQLLSSMQSAPFPQQFTLDTLALNHVMQMLVRSSDAADPASYEQVAALYGSMSTRKRSLQTHELMLTALRQDWEHKREHSQLLDQIEKVFIDAAEKTIRAPPPSADTAAADAAVDATFASAFAQLVQIRLGQLQRLPPSPMPGVHSPAARALRSRVSSLWSLALVNGSRWVQPRLLRDVLAMHQLAEDYEAQIAVLQQTLPLAQVLQDKRYSVISSTSLVELFNALRGAPKDVRTKLAPRAAELYNTVMISIDSGVQPHDIFNTSLNDQTHRLAQLSKAYAALTAADGSANTATDATAVTPSTSESSASSASSDSPALRVANEWLALPRSARRLNSQKFELVLREITRISGDWMLCNQLVLDLLHGGRRLDPQGLLSKSAMAAWIASFEPRANIVGALKAWEKMASIRQHPAAAYVALMRVHFAVGLAEQIVAVSRLYKEMESRSPPVVMSAADFESILQATHQYRLAGEARKWTERAQALPMVWDALSPEIKETMATVDQWAGKPRDPSPVFGALESIPPQQAEKDPVAAARPHKSAAPVMVTVVSKGVRQQVQTAEYEPIGGAQSDSAAAPVSVLDPQRAACAVVVRNLPSDQMNAAGLRALFAPFGAVVSLQLRAADASRKATVELGSEAAAVRALRELHGKLVGIQKLTVRSLTYELDFFKRQKEAKEAAAAARAAGSTANTSPASAVAAPVAVAAAAPSASASPSAAASGSAAAASAAPTVQPNIVPSARRKGKSPKTESASSKAVEPKSASSPAAASAAPAATAAGPTAAASATPTVQPSSVPSARRKGSRKNPKAESANSQSVEPKSSSSSPAVASAASAAPAASVVDPSVLAAATMLLASLFSRRSSRAVSCGPPVPSSFVQVRLRGLPASHLSSDAVRALFAPLSIAVRSVRLGNETAYADVRSKEEGLAAVKALNGAKIGDGRIAVDFDQKEAKMSASNKKTAATRAPQVQP